MNKKRLAWAQHYHEALRRRLQRGARTGMTSARDLGRTATAIGLETLDLARIHEDAVFALTPVKCSARDFRILRKDSGLFFLKVLGPVEAGNRHLRAEIVSRKAAEESLRRSEQRHRHLLQQSRVMEQKMRHLSHQILTAQEEERKEISRELHDQIAQMLAGINVHLATLENTAIIGRSGFTRKIRDSQRMVEKSVQVIHRFARELRPPVLDELGLIPAFQAYLKVFTEQTGIRVSLKVFAGIEQLHSDKRTVLYRVAQAALTNVGRHAHASRTSVTIESLGDSVRMQVQDDGRAFDVERMFLSRKNKRLGLIGMRERVEMVGGIFCATSTPGEGTTIDVRIPTHSRKFAKS